MSDSSAPTAVIYVRISRDRVGAGLGVDRQEQDCRELAARLGLRVVEVYSDNDLSAYRRRSRPGYMRMFADLARPGAPRVVLVWHTDRLHRHPIELEEWITLAEAHGIVVHPVQAGLLDLATPAGRMVARQLGAVARYESEHKAERIKAKMVQKAAAGEWLGGRVPFGWTRVPGERDTDPGRLILVPAEAELIVTGTRMLLGGQSLRAVVRMWEASGLPPRASATWNRRSVKLMLARWRNAGVHEHRGEAGGPAKWEACRHDGDVITADDVRAVRAMFADRSDASGVGNRSAHLLSGIAQCVCGAPVMVGSQPGRTCPTYRCTVPGAGHVARGMDPIDELVLRVVGARLAQPDAADLLPAAGPGVDVAALRADAARARARLDELAVMLADGDLDRAGYRTARERVAGRLDAAEAALAAATRRSPLAPVLSAADPSAAFLAADVEVQRAIVRDLVEITLERPGPGRKPFNPETVKITWRAA